jgi:hypothetical protein
MSTRDRFSPNLNKGSLPPELLKELKLDNNPDDKVLDIMKAGGGTLNVSEVLVGYFKMFGEVKPRNYANAALYRLSKKGLIKPTGKKGEYTMNIGLGADDGSDLV